MFLIIINQRLGFSCAALASAMAAGQVQAQSVTYDNSAYNAGYLFSACGTIASGGSPTFGESFLAPNLSSVSLDSFTFYLQEWNGSDDTVSFQADIYSWNGTAATGSPLFSKSLLVTDNGAVQPVTVNTGGIALTPGADYIALFTTLDPASVTANGNSRAGFYWEIGDGGESTDNGGTSAWLNANDYSALNDSGSSWGSGTPFIWQATFNTPVATPEPSTIALAGLGITALLLRRNKSKK